MYFYGFNFRWKCIFSDLFCNVSFNFL